MAEQTKMAAYAVSLNFAGGPLICNVTVASSPEAAVAIVTSTAIQQLQIKGDLQGISIAPIEDGWLDFAVRAVKGMLPEGGNAQVLQLVPRPEAAPGVPMQPADVQASAIDAWRKRHCPWLAQEPDPPEPPVNWPAA